MSLLRDVTAPYSRLEAWAYDTFIAEAVFAFARTMADELLGELPQGARVLDVGCGGGQAALHLAGQRPDLHVTGVDLAPGQVARAQRRARSRALAERAEFVQGSALELPWPDGSFDAVMSCASIKHWPDRRRGLDECVRVLRPGGGLLVAEADRGARVDDARRFVERWAVPGPARELGHFVFQRMALLPSLDGAELEALADGLPLDDRRVFHRPGIPAVFLAGRKR